MITMRKRYNDLNHHLRSIFGERVQKLTVDAGFSCPNRDGTLSTGGCIYCSPKGSGTGAHALGLSISEQIMQSKPGLIRRYKARKFMVYFQAFSNTYGPLEKLKAVYDEALSFDDVVALSIGTRPDCVDEPVLDLLGDYAKKRLIWMEYGLQSPHDNTLITINRGHDFACFKSVLPPSQKRGLKVCAHIILGLPGEDRAMMLEGAKILSDLGVDGVKIHLLYVIKNTVLETMYQNGDFHCLEKDEYAQLVCDYLERLSPDMVIHRITGDPHPDELVAPQWPLKKSDTTNLIGSILEQRDSYQGQYYNR
ncbi:MAG: TIGR01212 family radical SAM protein [Proteobacteria bacterium]|nr:TIGR01212 family radical SAM protein [Pseudomonadota bacterium]